MKKIAAIALAGTLSLSALPALAHHSATMYAPTETVTVTGTVKEFEYANPHAWILVDVLGAGGSVTTWAFEMGSVSMVNDAGIHKRDIAPGMQLTVTGHPFKDARPGGQFIQAVRADGHVFNARSPSG